VRTLRIVCAACLVMLVLSAIGGCSSSSNSGNTSGGSTNSGSGMMGRSGSGSGNYASVGEQIYLTGVGSDGQTVSHTAPRVSQGALMMGGGGCGSCHAADGKGGTIKMMMGTAIKAPDITYGALLKTGFTDATIRRAITKGLDESGKSLNVAMPRWQMSTTDLDATIAYLKQLGA
jgi:mono/diheme cytochrome c family protein